MLADRDPLLHPEGGCRSCLLANHRIYPTPAPAGPDHRLTFLFASQKAKVNALNPTSCSPIFQPIEGSPSDSEDTSAAVIARNPEKSASCIDLGNELGITLDTATTAIDILLSTDVVINTTPAGVADDFANLLSVARGTLLEVIYNPWPTKLATAWQAKSLTVVPGYEMLLHQAVRQVELMTGQIPNVDVMRTAMLAELSVRGITPIN